MDAKGFPRAVAFSCRRERGDKMPAASVMTMLRRASVAMEIMALDFRNGREWREEGGGGR